MLTRLADLGLEVTGQRLEESQTGVACCIADGVRWYRRSGARGALACATKS